MGRFVSGADVKEIRAAWWDEGETVTIKKLTYGDRQRVMKEAVKLRMGENGTFSDAELGAANVVLLEVGIAAWTFTYDGKRIPITRTWIERLSEEDADFILSELNAMNRPRRSAEEQETFRDAGGDSAADGERAPA